MPQYRLPRGGTQAASGLWLWRFAIEIPVLFGSLWLATEYIAWRFNWHPNLGEPLVKTALGNVYLPWEWIRWCWYYHNLPGTQSWWHHAVMIVSVAHIAPLISLVFVIRRDRAFGKSSDLHGSARWATAKDVKYSGLYRQAEGVYVGGWQEGKTLHYLRHNGPEHVLAFAPTRSGKGVSLVIPTLLSCSHSVLVNDIKGEDWSLTAGWRKQQGHVVLRFDPTCQDGSGSRYNPLLEVRPYPQDVRDVQNIAVLLIDPDGTSKWDHWDRTAYDLITGAMLHQLYVGRDKTLAGCFHLLTDPRRNSTAVLTRMLSATHDPSGHYGWVDTETGQPTTTHPVVAGAARAVLNKSENERSSVISSAISFFDLYRDPIVARNTSTCDFSLRDLMHHETPVSLYLTTPPSDLARTRPLFRLLLSQLGHRLTEEMQGARDGYRAGHRLLFMVDEFASLGKLDFFNTALTWAAGYGIQCYLILQDLTQLDRVYGRDSSIMANCHIRVAFTPNTSETAKILSEMLGTQTVSKEMRTYTGSRFAPWLNHVIASDQESQRSLLTPDELLTMPEQDALIFAGGRHPIYGQKIRYYQDPEFLRRSQIPPPAQSDRLPLKTNPWTYVGPQHREPEVIEVTQDRHQGREMEGLL